MRASLRAEYGIDLRQVREGRTMQAGDLADLVAHLPAGCAFWAAVGGPAAISAEVRAMRHLGYWLRVLDYRERGSKGEKPKPDQEPSWAHERRDEGDVMRRKAAAHMRRQG